MTTIILNPELFGAPDCDHQVAAFAKWVKASPHGEDAPVLLPGEWEVNTREARLAQGIPLDLGSWQAICEAAQLWRCRRRCCKNSVIGWNSKQKSPSSGRANKG